MHICIYSTWSISPICLTEIDYLINFPFPSNPQAKYISTCIEEIKQELRQDNISVKCNAVAKLTYVSQLLGRNLKPQESQDVDAGIIIRVSSLNM